MTTQVSRRSFLKESARFSGLAVALVATGGGFEVINAAEKEFKPSAWLEITPDNKVIITTGQTELGQGTHTAHGKIIADELGAAWEQVEVKMGGAHKAFFNPWFPTQMTGGSMSIRSFWSKIRTLGAASREMLETAAAKRWHVPAGECETRKGTIVHQKSGRSLTFGEVCQAAATLPIPKKPKLKSTDEFYLIGQDIPRIDVPAKAAGEPIYGLDFEVPGMLTAVVVRPTVYGAKPSVFNQAKAMRVKGVVAVLPIPAGVAVCAESFDAALKGKEALDVTWKAGTHTHLNDASIESAHFDQMATKPLDTRSLGNVPKALGKADQTLDFSYYTPYISHAILEPMTCTAEVNANQCDIWVPTQSQTVSQMIGVQVTGLKPEQVKVHTLYNGGAFGRRSQGDFVVDAVVLSKIMKKPVKVVWTKEENMQNGFYRPATAHRVSVGLTQSGQISGWQHKLSSTSIFKTFSPQSLPPSGADANSLSGIWHNPPAKHSTTYDIHDFQVDLFQPDMPIPVHFWRSVAEGANIFVIESIMDELAHAAKVDPLDFRLKRLKKNPRAAQVLKKVAQAADWGRSTPQDHGRGLAVMEGFGSFVGYVIDVAVDRSTGVISVKKITAAVDCGIAVSPKNIKMQFEGGAVMGISAALKEEVHFEEGGVVSSNYDNYPILRMSEAPEVDVHIIESRQYPGGIGEPPVPPTAPAVANAVFDAVGIRLRRIPFTPKSVLSALSSV